MRQVRGYQPSLALFYAVPIGLLGGLIGLGVAGGESIIPTLVFAFGADIQMAGTGSFLGSLPTVVVGGCGMRAVPHLRSGMPS
jgi:hypothetical protein